MDLAMHRLWLSAERRIDASLALIVACGVWITAIPLATLLANIEWSSTFTMILLASIPVALLCIWPLRAGLKVVRAIEERDKDEMERWKAEGIAPKNPGFIVQRLRRVHYPTLAVISLSSFALSIFAFVARIRTTSPAMSNFALGIALSGLGIALCTVMLMLAGRLSSRALLGFIILFSWIVPVGGGITSLAVIAGRRTFETELAVRAITTMGYVIVGIIGILISVVLLALWFAWVTLWWSGRGLEVNARARELPESDGLSTSEEEFDVEDLAIIRQAMKVPRSIYVSTFVVVAVTAAIVVVGSGALAGGVVHIALGLVLMSALVLNLRQNFSL